LACFKFFKETKQKLDQNFKDQTYIFASEKKS